MAKGTYDSSDITSLGDLEAIRLRPGMYIGDTSDPSQLLVETFDNAVDEVQSGHSDEATISVDTGGNVYAVRDHGRGIPHGKSTYKDPLGNDVEVETLRLVFTKSHSGGKFGGDAYRKSRGLHGVGLKAVNALSTHARAVSYRRGEYVLLDMTKGEVTDLSYGKVSEGNPIPGDDGKDGTYVEFSPDPEVFESDVIPERVILELAGVSEAFGSRTRVFVDGEERELPYHRLYDLLPRSQSDGNEYFETEFHVESETTESMDVAIRYTSDTNTLYRGYTNTIPNPSGGSHVRFFESCYKEAWERYLTKGFKPEDVLVGLRAVVGVFISNGAMAFAGQTKERLTTRVSYFEPFRKRLVRSIRRFLNDNPKYRKGLIRRFEEYRRGLERMRASKELDDTVYVEDSKGDGNVRRRSVVEKLRECSSKSREGTQLLLTEGDSAAGAVLQARDVRYDAILPIRGKILNVSNVTPVQAMKNEEVKSIVNAAGTGMLDQCDAGKSRYDRYLICCDRDEDGLNISALLASIFVNLLPDLVREGMVYVVVPPLYSWVDREGTHYTSELSEIRDKSRMTRFKGLGEMDPEDIKATFMDRENQELIRLGYPDDLDSFNEAMTSAQMRYDMLCERGLVVRA